MSNEFISALNRKNYEDEAKLDSYNLKNVKRPPLQINFKIPKHENEDKMVNRDDIADISLRDLTIDDQLVKIANSAIPDMPRKQKPVISEVTAEMIADYQAEQNQPIVIDGKSYAYHPVNLDIDLDPIPDLPIDMSEERKTKFARDRRVVVGALDEVKKAIQRYDQLLKNASTFFDTQQAEIQNNAKAGTITSAQAREALSNNRRQYEEFVAKNEQARTRLSMKEQELRDDLQFLGEVESQNAETYSQNRAEIARIQLANRNKLEDATQAFNVLNSGRASVQKFPTETDEEYAQRLRDTGNAREIPQEELIQRAELRQTEKLINNLKTIIKPEQASNISKMLNRDQKYEINKFFPKIKTAYDKTFSKTVKVPEQELINFFLDEIGYKDKPLLEFVPTATAFSGFEEPVPDLFEAEVVQTPVVRAVRATRASKQPTRKDMIAELRGNPANKGDPRLNSIESRPLAEVEIVYQEVTRNPQRLRPISKRDELLGLAAAEPDIEEQIGEGIQSKRLPKRSQFGKVSINPHKLYHKNILSVRNLKGQAIGVRDIPVSEGMSELLLGMLQGKNPSKKDFAILAQGEPSLYDNLIHLAQLHKNFETPNLNDTKSQMKHRMELLQGQIEAGNTAPSILSEAKQLLRLMVGNGMLKSTQARKHYDYLKNYN